MNQLKRVLLPMFSILIAACAGGEGVATSTTEAVTTTQAAATSSASIEATTTTTLPPTFDIDYTVRVYDLFESSDGLEVGAGCIALGELNGLRAQARLVVRDDAENVVGSAQMSPGTLQYDDSGPAIGQEQDDLFYYCAFEVEFRDMSLTDAGVYRIEFPIGMTSDVITPEDFTGGVGTSFSQQNLEDERQRIRSG